MELATLATETGSTIRLYIAGSTPNSLRALQSLRDATSAMNDAACLISIDVIDVFKGPKRAIADGILVTPTLIAQYAGKRVMMVGDLSDAAALRSILDACAHAQTEPNTTASAEPPSIVL
jgi:circadian clock protein KaiB